MHQDPSAFKETMSGYRYTAESSCKHTVIFKCFRIVCVSLRPYKRVECSFFLMKHLKRQLLEYKVEPLLFAFLFTTA